MKITVNNNILTINVTISRNVSDLHVRYYFNDMFSIWENHKNRIVLLELQQKYFPLIICLSDIITISDKFIICGQTQYPEIFKVPVSEKYLQYVKTKQCIIDDEYTEIPCCDFKI